MTTYAVLEQIPLDVMPGDELTCGLMVRNNSDVVEAYRFEVVGELAPWTAVEPAELSVYPGTDQSVTVRFTPPRSSRVAPGDTAFAVRVLPTERPGDAVAPEGVVHVRGFQQTTAEVTPRTSTARRNARHEVAVDNRGNVPVHASVTGVDPDDQLRLRSRPSVVTIEPGSTEFVRIFVRHRRWLWQGTPVTHPFQVQVAAEPAVDIPVEAESPIPLDAGSVQIALIPRGVRRFAMAMLALAVLAAGAWFLLLRPAVRSAAAEAVQAPLQQVADQAKTADKKADDAKEKADTTEQVVNKSGAGNGQPKPGKSTAPGTRSSPTTINLQTNLAPGTTPRTDTLTIKERTTLVVTDLVLQNPQGDAGRVDVVVDGNSILTLSLANFRDLDYHFVSPIEITAGKTLSLRTVCQTPGPPIVGTTAGQCRVSMFATGTNRVRAASSAPPS